MFLGCFAVFIYLTFKKSSQVPINHANAVCIYVSGYAIMLLCVTFLLPRST